MIRAIVAVDKNWGIGKKNDLLFSLPLDMKFFRQTTLDKTVCMGYNTLLSFPNSNPLPRRKNIVLCPEGIEREDAVIVHTLDGMLAELKKEDGDVFVIGGAMFYKTMLPYCEEVLVTKVDADGEAEVFYDNLDENPDFTCVKSGEPIETNGYNIQFTTYKNNNVKYF
ncbi:MAG: dihydrofolate reductase [Clostridiales bacterium]|nr:dihydrofolate reductase [Clostridiales bacterium]